MPGERIEFRILGPLEAGPANHPIGLGSTKQRMLLAFLLLHGNRVVSRDHLLAAVWGDSPPETAGTALHGYVSSLRKALGTDRIETRAPGYVLRIDEGELDLDRFEQLVAEARSADPAAAADRLQAALELWAGEPLADLDGTVFVEAERRRLEERRLTALESRIDADLALGRQEDLVAELDALVVQHPLRERLRGQLMLALYRSGRQTDALEVYRRGRTILAEDLGLEPGEALRRLERSILEQDPSLEEPAPPHVVVASSGAPRRRYMRWSVVAAAVLGIVAIGGMSILAARDGDEVVVVPNSVAVIDAGSGALVSGVPVGRRPVAIAVGEDGVWVANADDETVVRVDPETKEIVGTFGLGTDVSDIAVGFGSIWVAEGNDGTLTRIDPRANTLQETLRLDQSEDPLSGQPVFWVATGAGAVWVVKGGRLLRIDPTTSEVLSSLPIPAATGLAANADGAWVTTQDQRLLRISRDGRQMTGGLEFPALAGSPIAVEGDLWAIVNVGPGEVWRIDPATLGQEATGRIKTFPVDIAAADGQLWAVGFDGAIVQLDPLTIDVIATTRLEHDGDGDVAVGSGAVWVTVQPSR